MRERAFRIVALAASVIFVTLPSIGAALTRSDSEPSREESRRKKSVELTAGSDGIAGAIFVTPGGGRLSVGVRAALGYEWADFRWDDPSAALDLRWRLLASDRWAWWVGTEAGVARIDTGYARFLVPFACAVTGGSFGFTKRLSLSLEAGARYGRRDLESSAALDFLDVRYEETYFLDPVLVRLGLAFSL